MTHLGYPSPKAKNGGCKMPAGNAVMKNVVNLYSRQKYILRNGLTNGIMVWRVECVHNCRLSQPTEKYIGIL